MIDSMHSIMENADCEFETATLGTIAEEYRKVAPKVDPKELLKLDRRGYGGKKTV